MTSVNRFFLATAQAVVPRLVPTEDLLAANSIATVGGTVALLAGVFAGGLVADAFGTVAIVVTAAAMWVVRVVPRAQHPRATFVPCSSPSQPSCSDTSFGGSASSSPMGCATSCRRPRAVGPITSIGLDQIGQGLILVLALVVFRERFDQGVGSFSWLIGAGGVGVFAGLATIGALDRRFRKRAHHLRRLRRRRALRVLLVSLLVAPWTLLLASFFVGLTFAWKKVPVDTMVQEAVPDGLRGRVFAAYDVVYNVARLCRRAARDPSVADVRRAGFGRARRHRIPVLGTGATTLAREGARDPAAVRRRREGEGVAASGDLGRCRGTGRGRAQRPSTSATACSPVGSGCHSPTAPCST